MFRFGLRAHDFTSGSPEEAAKTLAAFDAGSIQLAPYKLFPSWAGKPGPLDAASTADAAAAFQAWGIRVAVLGCYINPVHPDPDVLDSLLSRFEDHLERCADFGCSLVGTETGSLAPDCSYHTDTARPETFARFCRSLERLLGAAEARGAVLGIEPVAHQHTIDSPEAVRRLRSRLDCPALGFIWDPVNLLPLGGLSGPEGIGGQEAFFRECRDAFGPRIVAVHAKDFRMEGGRKIGDLSAGTGSMDYEAFFRFACSQPNRAA